ncbi:MAG: hypothetical protein ABSB56_08575, partial [Nitrososphaerales archaeon]
NPSQTGMRWRGTLISPEARLYESERRQNPTPFRGGSMSVKWCAIVQLRPTIAALESHSLSAKVLDQDEVRRSRT